ncbi:MAG: serine protease [Prolixibacteraceae bacterium]|jgi:S1-C subfamily serine protease|nr:serine protease [Prolixibacteraceae bacterium]
MKKYLTITFILLTVGLFAQSTSWNKHNLKEHWKANGIDEIEGIYEDTQKHTKHNPKMTYGLIKTNSGYTLVFLKVLGGKRFNGPYKDYNYMWNPGDVQAYLYPTATPYLFKSKYYRYDKTIFEDFYMSFEKGIMKFVLMYEDWEHIFLKLYPSINDNVTYPNSSSKQSSGTGFGISSTGIIVTNFHVIDGAKTIKVRGINLNFNKTYKAKVLFSDKNNDLALIQIDDYGFNSLGTIPFTIKTELSGVGEKIFVLGYPLRATMGDEIKLTNGIVTSMTGFQGDITSYQIQTPVQPGNSGSPLFDSQGNLIGIINAKHGEAESASYAVKTSYLTNLIDLLPKPLKLQKVNSMKDKSLTQQVELVKRFVYIIETE